MSEKSSLALIVPCYNEAPSIPYFETELSEFLVRYRAAFPGEYISVTVVDNGSDDGSAALLEEMRLRRPELRVETCLRRGYGAALKSGFGAVEAEYMAFLDLDNTYPLDYLIPMLQRLRHEKLDMIYGARIHAGSEISFVRGAGNRLYVFLLRMLLRSRLSDVCSGMRIFRTARRDEVLALKADDLSFSIDFSAMAALNSWKLGELPIPYRERVGESKLSVVRDGFLFLFVVLRRWLS